MKKTIISLAVITAIYQPATAATEQVTENLVITANRVAQQEIDVLASVDVISREQIELLQPASVADLLSRSTGLTIVRQGGAAQRTALFTRGTSSDHTLILIDGVRVDSLSSGDSALSALSPSQIERIEIIKGPRAALYGSDAIGGVIQIFTREQANGQISTNVELASFNTQKLDASLGFATDQLTNTLTVSTDKSDGFSAKNDEPDSDGYRRDSVSLKGKFDALEQISFNWLARLDKGSYDYDNTWGGDQSEYDNHLVNLGAIYALDGTSVRFEIANSQNKSLDYGKHVSKADGALYETDNREAKLNFSQTITDELNVLAGLDWQLQELTSSTAYSAKSRRSVGHFVSFNAQMDSVLVDIAARYDEISNVGSEWTYNASFGYKFQPDWLLSLNYGTAFNAPTFNDLFYPWSGNPNLKPETSESLELLIKTTQKGLQLDVALYQTKIDDLISWTGMTSDNVDRARINGLEINMLTQAWGIDWQMAATFLDTEDRATGKDLIRRPEQSFRYSGTYQYKKWRFSADVLFNGSTLDQAWDDNFNAYDVTLDSYVLLNGYVAYTLSDKIQLKAYTRNLLDEAYQNAYEYNTPGREIGLVFSYKN